MDERRRLMAEAYRNGATLQAIGTDWDLTRERVRQLIKGLVVMSYNTTEPIVRYVSDCEGCGKEIMVNGSHYGRRFCNQECSKKSKGILFHCLQCGKLVRTTKGKVEGAIERGPTHTPKYCSRACLHTHRNVEYRGVANVWKESYCPQCHRVFKHRIYDKWQPKYCSTFCGQRSRARRCQNCGKEFYRTVKNRAQFFCSQRCFGNAGGAHWRRMTNR